MKFESYVKARVGWHGLKSDDFTDKGPYLVTGTDFSGSRINWQDCHHCDDWRYDQDPYIQLREGDLLVTKDGTIGKLALVEGLDGKATLNSGVFVVRPLTTRYTSRFYFWLLQSSVFHGFVEYRKTGSTIVHLYQETFENFSFAMPPLEEQNQIAKFLDYETTKIDALIEKQQQLIALLKEKRQAVISHAVTKGLNRDAPMRDSGVEWLGEVPAHWLVIRSKFLFRLFGGYAFKGEYFTKESEDLPTLVTPGNFMPGGGLYFTEKNKTQFAGNCPARYKLFRGDLLMVLTDLSYKKLILGSTAFVETDDLLLNQRIAKICVSDRAPHRIDRRFLSLLLNSDPLRDQVKLTARGATVFHSSSEKIGDCWITVPPFDEQWKIVEQISEATQQIRRIQEKAAAAVVLLQERRSALISAAVTGKIDVRGWKAPESEAEAEDA